MRSNQVVEEHLSPAQCAQRLGVSVATIWRLLRRRELRAVRIGERMTRIPASSVNRMLERCRT